MGPSKSLALLAAILMAPMAALADDGQRIEAGRAVYQTVCIACHAPENVMVSAPKAGDVAEWARRAARNEGGIGMLTDNAINGFGAMPPKGGAAGLTPAQIRDAIEFMRAPSPARGANHR